LTGFPLLEVAVQPRARRASAHQHAVCAGFGALSGSSLSVAATVGSVAHPELTRQGHGNRAVVGSLAGGGTLGLLLPPSLALLILGALADTSIGRLIFAELGSLFTGLATPTEAPGVGVTRGEVLLAEAARGALPCWVCLLVAIGLPAVVAGLATWLPGVIYG
jgi:TRAP-type C4-dicarboxylate transport system permease large subunit